MLQNNFLLQKEKIGDKVKSLREKKGLTQRELANHALIGIDTVRRIEQKGADIRFSSMVAIARVLDCSLDTFRN